MKNQEPCPVCGCDEFSWHDVDHHDEPDGPASVLSCDACDFERAVVRQPSDPA